MPIKEIGRKHGFSDALFYKWRSKYGGMDVSEAKRLRELELESGKLKLLAVSSAKRNAQLGDVPTVNESLTGFLTGSWQGLLAPAGTPRRLPTSSTQRSPGSCLCRTSRSGWRLWVPSLTP